MAGDNGVVVLEDTLNHECWRRVHFLSGDERAFQKAWDQRLVSIPWESADAVITQRYTEAGIQHGVILWPLRGQIVKYENLVNIIKDQCVVIWVLFKRDDRVSTAVKTCAWYYYAFYDVWPDTAWIGADMAVHDGKTVDVDGHVITLVLADWMAKMGVGLGIADS
ncbi:MAG: hypothetical protein ACOX5F_00900 [Anaerovoracaceae bacterium]|jgi:hypothetical protein